VQVTLLSRAADLLAPGSVRDLAHAGRQRLENRVESSDRLVRAADHHAVAALQAPHSTAGPHVDVLDLFRCEIPRAADIVHIVGVAAVDEDVARLEQGTSSAMD